MNEKTVSVETLKLSKKSSEYLKNRGVETVEDLMHLSMAGAARSRRPGVDGWRRKFSWQWGKR